MSADDPKIALGVYGLSLRYEERQVLNEVSFELEAGEILALIGPNGSGKSSLLKAAAGLISLRSSDRSGQVRVNGQDFLSQKPALRARQIAYVGEEPRPDFPMTVLEAVSLGRFAHGGTRNAAQDPAIRSALDQTLSWPLRDRDLETLSGGERQRVAIARALAQGSRILFLDEALSKMDLNHQAWMGALLNRLAEGGYAIVLVSHDLNFAAEWSKSALLLSSGKKVAMGPVPEVVTTARLSEIYPGAQLVVGRSPQSGAPQIFFNRSIESQPRKT